MIVSPFFSTRTTLVRRCNLRRRSRKASSRSGRLLAFSYLETVMAIALPARYSQLTPRGRAAARAQYAVLQLGLCCHCQAPLDGPPAPEILAKPINWNLFPPDFTKWPLHLHHSHETGLTIGVVHAYCNADLWQYHGE